MSGLLHRDHLARGKGRPVIEKARQRQARLAGLKTEIGYGEPCGQVPAVVNPDTYGRDSVQRHRVDGNDINALCATGILCPANSNP